MNSQRLAIAKKVITKASMDTGACYGVKKCAEMDFKAREMIKEDCLNVLNERIKALDQEQVEIYKFLGCEQGGTMKRLI